MQHRDYEYVCMGVCVIHVCICVIHVCVCVIHVCVWVYVLYMCVCGCMCYTCVCVGVCVWVKLWQPILKQVAIVMISLFEKVVFNVQLVNYLLKLI